MKMVSLGGKDFFPMGYVIVSVQLYGVVGYDEE